MTLETIYASEIIPVENSLYSIIRTQDIELPREFLVEYLDINNQYQVGSQRSRRLITSSIDSRTTELAISMTGNKAKQIAEILHYTAWNNRHLIKLQVTPKWLKLEPATVINLDTGVRVYTIRILSISFSNNIVEIEAVTEIADSFTSSSEGFIADNEAPAITIVPNTSVQLIDGPIMGQLSFTNGYYVAANGKGTEGWRGCVTYKSIDGGVTYDSMHTILTEAVIGSIITDLPSPARHYTYDQENTVRVALDKTTNTLSSISETLLLGEGNLAAVGSMATGWEIIQFQTATLVDTGIYDLSVLIRARYGTENFTSHIAYEKFILLDTGTMGLVDSSTSAIGSTRIFKGVSIGQNIAEAESFECINNGRILTPYSVVHLAYADESSGDIVITWIRRSRYDAEWRDYVGVPLNEDSEIYEIDIIDTDGTTVLNTYTATDAATYTYTSAQQTSDSFAGSGSIFNVYQKSATVGRGDVAGVTYQ